MQVMTRKKSAKPIRARDRGTVKVLTSEFDPALYAALDTFVDSHKPKTTRRAILEWAVEEFLTKRQAWPLK